jgi:hypothetical protein
VALLIAAGAAVIAYKNERVFAAATEVTRELEKVTWPTRKETSAAHHRRHRDGGHRRAHPHRLRLRLVANRKLDSPLTLPGLRRIQWR